MYGWSDLAASESAEVPGAMSSTMESGLNMLMVGMLPAELFASTAEAVWKAVEGMTGPGSSGRFVYSEMIGAWLAGAFNDSELTMLEIPRLRVIETFSRMSLALSDLTQTISPACDATAASMADWRSEKLPYVGAGVEAKATMLGDDASGNPL